LQTRRAALPRYGIVARRFFPRYPGIDAALKRALIFLFATLSAAVISVVLPMNSPQPRRPSILREPRNASVLASPLSLVRPAFQRSDAPFVPAAGIPQIISIISSG
jgi:hypothetical protein